MKYVDYHLPSGVDFSSITYEDIRWQYGVFRCNSTGSGRDKKHLPWDGVKTNLGEIEEKDWCRLAEAVIERDGETHLLKHLIQWCSEHNYIGASATELRKEALQLHIDRVFDNPQWGGYLPFNKRYRPEVWRAAHIVYVRNECCHKISPVTQEQIDHAYNGTIPCPHCGRWSEFIVLGIRLQPEPLVPFNKRYRPEVWRAAHIVYVRNECCHKISPVTQEQIDHAYNGTIPCPHCGRWSEFIVLGIRLQPEPLVPCLNCDCHDPDMGCTMPSIDKSYACPLVSCDDEQTEVLDE